VVELELRNLSITAINLCFMFNYGVVVTLRVKLLPVLNSNIWAYQYFSSINQLVTGRILLNLSVWPRYHCLRRWRELIISLVKKNFNCFPKRTNFVVHFSFLLTPKEQIYYFFYLATNAAIILIHCFCYMHRFVNF